MCRFAPGAGFLGFVLALTPVGAQTTKPASFAKDIAPLLTARCMQCHGQSPLMGGLDLRTRETALKGGQHGPAIVPGDSAKSHIYRHLTGAETPQMPLGSRLSEAEIELVKQWIDSGAAWDTGVALAPPPGTPASGERKFTEQQRRYWAFQKVMKPAVPAVNNAAWAVNPIDAFVEARLEEKKLQPNPPADKITLLRRATLDLTGLPPSPDEVQGFLADNSPDAFVKVVDRLLASPHYGERWGRHWLDLARYADSNGFKADETRPNMWRYRDYVIQAFNEDKPYDRFIREQIAGDELYPNDLNARIAVAFNRHYTDETNQPVLELRRQEILNDITDTVGAVFLGMTYGCARCHDHKFDPILHKDYYRLQAFFANIREDDHLNLLHGDELARWKQQESTWEEKTRSIRDQMHALVEPIAAKRADYYKHRFSPGTRKALETPAEQRTPLQAWLAIKATPQITYKEKDLVKELNPEDRKRYDELSAQLAQYDSIKPPDPPEAQTLEDGGRQAPATHVLAVGNWDVPKEEVQPGFLSILDPSDAKIAPPAGMESTGRRTALANWLADARNPLTARVMVNRIWHYHFGQGIVASTSDFGVMGDRPTNQKLLDYLAATFVEDGWSIKKLTRRIMLSHAYQESSAYQKEAAAADPEDKLQWRYPRHREEGEEIRDSMLYVSGLLNPKMGGPGVHPELPPGTVPAKYGSWNPEKDPAEADRRSVYIFEKRVMVYPMFEAFDAPNPQESCPRRFRTVIPSQALMLMNDRLVLEWSRALAGRVLNDSGLSAAQQVDRAWRLALSRAPNAEERRTALNFLDEQSEVIGERLAQKEKVALPENAPANLAPARAAAFVDFCHALLNSNEFLYVN
jgi:hypothetical protein